MPWDTGDLRQQIELIRQDQRAQVALAEEAMSTELSALATVDRARAVMRHCADAIEQDARELDVLLDELPRAESCED